MASKKTSAAILTKRIARDNAAFDKLSAQAKRIHIARDVIAQIQIGKIVAQQGVYGRGKTGNLFGQLKVDHLYGEVEESQKVEVKAAKCVACGIGSMFICAVKKADRLFGKDLGGCGRNELNGDDARAYLERFFDSEDLFAIEDAFECQLDDQEANNAWSAVDDDNDRLILIMQNVIANKGAFDPEQAPVPVKFEMPGFKG